MGTNRMAHCGWLASRGFRRVSRGVSLGAALGCLWVGWPIARLSAAPPERPNVLVIMTDDQGYGDLGVHGNPKIKTPNLDKFAGESVRLKNFYVSPVCAPTRASLLTGRYNYRTGVVDTYLGRAMMHPDEVTLAEMLAAAGYRTGIFGKWHLGDNAPLRPIDQGFQEALVIKGGGIGQPSDPPGGSSYFDPVLQHNGQARALQGLLQRHLRPGRDRLHRRGRRAAFLRVSGLQLPACAARGSRAQSSPSTGR